MRHTPEAHIVGELAEILEPADHRVFFRGPLFPGHRVLSTPSIAPSTFFIWLSRSLNCCGERLLHESRGAARGQRAAPTQPRRKAEAERESQ